MKNRLRHGVTFLLLGMTCSVAAAQEKPRTEEDLQKYSKQYPAADANRDGVLTLDEALAHRQTLIVARQKERAAAIQPTFAEVAYGPAQRNVLDFYQAKSDHPTPLVVYIHGGGFVGGHKDSFNGDFRKLLLDAGISFATIHYRFVDGKDVIFPAPQHDGARAVQFLRSKAAEWNIDPRRVACYGSSAGAGMSMWIGFHDDLADSASSDPVLRQSTRVQAVATFGGQGTYDPIKIKELIGGRAWEHPSIFKVYGVMTAEEALHPSPERQKLYDESSAITHLTRDDPPLLMFYNEADGPLPADARPGQGIHHPNFGRQLKAKMDELGIENEFIYLPTNPTDPNRRLLAFFQRQFAAAK